MCECVIQNNRDSFFGRLPLSDAAPLRGDDKYWHDAHLRGGDGDGGPVVRDKKLLNLADCRTKASLV